jgi:hypothetical protein
VTKPAKTRLLRDFRRRSIFDFCQQNLPKAEVHPAAADKMVVRIGHNDKQSVGRCAAAVGVSGMTPSSAAARITDNRSAVDE